MNRMEWSTRGGGLTEIVTEASWREIGKVLQTSYSGRGKDSPKSEPTLKIRRTRSIYKSNLIGYIAGPPRMGTHLGLERFGRIKFSMG